MLSFVPSGFVNESLNDSSMKSASKGQQPPEFISTHPSHDTRISNFDDWMPSALMKFESDAGERCRQVRQDMRAARLLAAQGHSQGEEKQTSWSSSTSNDNKKKRMVE